MKKLFLLLALSSLIIAGCISGGAVVGVQATPVPTASSQLPVIDSQYWQVKGATAAPTAEATISASATPAASATTTVTAATIAPAVTPAPTATPVPLAKQACGDVSVNLKLSRNVIAAGEGACFTASASGIVIDCDGKTISGTGTVGVMVDGKSNVAVKNCKFDGFKTAVVFQGASGGKISGNQVISFTGDNAIRVSESTGVGVEGNVVAATTGNAIDLVNSPSTTVSGNTLSASTKAGFGIRSTGAATEVSGNKVSGFGVCIALWQTTSSASGNTLEGCDKAIDITLGSADIKANTISNSNTGIQAGGNGNSIKQNTITGSSSDGIILLGIQNLVSANKVCGSGTSDLFAVNAPQQGSNDNTCRPGKCGPSGANLCSGTGCSSSC